MAAFFSKHRLQIHRRVEGADRFLRSVERQPGTRPPVFPDGTPARIAPDQDPREVFADWLTSPQNPWFARAIVNRVWSWLLGRGIVQEPDDIRPDNPPVNPELLAWLEHELVNAHFDLKHLLPPDSEFPNLSTLLHPPDR
jgi:hypothetical protein